MGNTRYARLIALVLLLSATDSKAGLEDANYQVSVIPYDLRDVSASGTNVPLTDDQVAGPFPIGFAFQYYGELYTQFYISSNGFITFNPGSNSGCCSGVPIPTPGGINNFVAGFWEDLNPPAGGSVRYQILGTPPNRQLVVGFYQIEHLRGNTPVEMEIILHQSTNNVELQYTTATTTGEGNHSVGVESAGGQYGTQVDYGNGFSYFEEGRLLTPEGTGGGTDESIARFAVSKQFSDNNPADVGVTITCNTGLPLEQNATIAQGDDVTFVVTDFEADTMDCEVTESPVPEGYGAAYSTNGGFTFPSFESCVYEDVGFGAENTCLIVNDLDQVLVEVSKSWIDENPGFDHVNYAEAQFDCQNEQYGIHAFGILEFVGDDAVDGFFVFPRWDGTTSCTITETVVEGGVDFDDTECQQLQVLPGSGASCTLYNTRLYEGIPTLSQYGLALLALLMLGMGLVGYRRIA